MIFLVDLNVERCRQCDPDGWGPCRREGKCIIDDDDFDTLMDKVNAADVVLFATPVYFGDITESMRNFLERMRRARFHMGPPPPGSPATTPLRPNMPVTGGKPTVGLCLAGGGGGGSPSCAASLERILQGIGFDLVDWILLRRQNFDFKLPLLELTGQWLATVPNSGPPRPPR
jgi:multimeric flavodoxin WrbA